MKCANCERGLLKREHAQAMRFRQSIWGTIGAALPVIATFIIWFNNSN